MDHLALPCHFRQLFSILRDETSEHCCTLSSGMRPLNVVNLPALKVESRKMFIYIPTVCYKTKKTTVGGVVAHVKYDLIYTRLGVQAFISLFLIYTHSICIFFM